MNIWRKRGWVTHFTHTQSRAAGSTASARSVLGLAVCNTPGHLKPLLLRLEPQGFLVFVNSVRLYLRKKPWKCKFPLLEPSGKPKALLAPAGSRAVPLLQYRTRPHLSRAPHPPRLKCSAWAKCPCACCQPARNPCPWGTAARPCPATGLPCPTGGSRVSAIPVLHFTVILFLFWRQMWLKRANPWSSTVANFMASLVPSKTKTTKPNSKQATPTDGAV